MILPSSPSERSARWGTLGVAAVALAVVLLPFLFAAGYVFVSLGVEGRVSAGRLAEVRGNALILFVMGAGVAGLVSFGLAESLRAALVDVTRKVEAVGRGEFGDRVTERGPIELSALAKAANAASASMRRREAELMEAEKMSTIGTLVAGLAHEINNPLAFMRSNLEIVALDLPEIKAALPPERRAVAERLEAAVSANLGGLDRLSRVNESLRRMSGAEVAVGERHRLEDVVEGCLLVAHGRLGAKVSVLKEFGETPAVECDAAAVSQVLLQLILNAADAMPDGGVLTVRTEAAGASVAVSVSDSGRGIPDLLKGRVFEPFFTTKANGAGLGLFLARRAALELGGELSFESNEGIGTTFRVTLPTCVSSDGRSEERLMPSLKPN